jgi:competence protein ComFC
MGQRFVEIIKYYLNCLAGIVYPRLNQCFSCRNEIEEDEFICTKCLEGIRKVDSVFYLSDIKSYSFAYYSSSIKKLINNFKYNRDFYCGEYLAKLLGDKIKNENIEADIITFVPSSKNALKKRGFNQCEFLAKILSKNIGIPYVDTLLRIKDGQEQKRLSKDERLVNMNEAFQVIEGLALENKKIILVDDVVTTGATLLSCCNQLRKYSEVEIIILTIAKSYI